MRVVGHAAEWNVDCDDAQPKLIKIITRRDSLGVPCSSCDMKMLNADNLRGCKEVRGGRDEE